MNQRFDDRIKEIEEAYEKLITRKNQLIYPGNGIYERYKYPILTAAHTPIYWRYDLSPETNPYFMERFGINGVFNAGAIKWKDKYLLVARVEGNDRKSFLLLPKARTAWIISGSGNILFVCLKPIHLIPMYTICD